MPDFFNKPFIFPLESVEISESASPKSLNDSVWLDIIISKTYIYLLFCIVKELLWKQKIKAFF